MNNTFKLALGLVMSLGLIGGAVAQNFPDVPDNHWAYEALERMKREGLLMGYPDGLFRGNRPATRYEMAVAIHATYSYLKNITDNLQKQIDELKGGQGNDGGLRAALEALKADVERMKGWEAVINDLKRMSSAFEKDLAAMGVDVEAMKKDLAALNERVTKLEKNALPITIHGDMGLFVQTGIRNSKRFGLGTDGQVVGFEPGIVDPADSPSPGIFQSLNVFHQAYLKLAGTNEAGPKWHAVLEIGNLTNGYGNTANNTTGAPNDTANTDLAFRRFVVDFDTALVGQGFNAKIGRLGYKISPYILMAPDTNPYYADPMDNGEYTLDGAVLGFNFGAAKFNLIVGRNTARNTSQGTDLGSLSAGNLAPGRAQFAGSRVVGLNRGLVDADTTLGAHLNVPIGEAGSVDLAFLQHNAKAFRAAGAAGLSADKVQTIGGALNYKATDAVSLNGGYSQSNVYFGDKSRITRNNFAWNVGLGYEAEKWGLMVGYREIQPHFGAAGDWGRIGTWWNPTDIKGFSVGGHIDLTDQLTLNAKGEFVTGLGKRYDVPGVGTNIEGLRTGDRIDSYSIGLDYKIAEGWSAMLGGEFVDFKVDGVTGRARQRWYNIGFGYSLSDMAKLSILWQISDADAKATGLWAAPGNATGRFTGNLITTQLSVKF